jgi:hypothetical protein
MLTLLQAGFFFLTTMGMPVKRKQAKSSPPSPRNVTPRILKATAPNIIKTPGANTSPTHPTSYIDFVSAPISRPSSPPAADIDYSSKVLLLPQHHTSAVKESPSQSSPTSIGLSDGDNHNHYKFLVKEALTLTSAQKKDGLVSTHPSTWPPPKGENKYEKAIRTNHDGYLPQFQDALGKTSSHTMSGASSGAN